MSQTPIPSSVTAAGLVQIGGRMVSAEELSADLNLVIRTLNGGLTDVNIRAIGGGYTGILETDVTFSTFDGPGHNHDGVNSALPGPNSYGTNIATAQTIKFLRAPYQSLIIPDDERMLVASGKLLAKWNTDREQIRPYVILPVNTAEFTPKPAGASAEMFAVCSASFVRTDPDRDTDHVACDAYVEETFFTGNTLAVRFRVKTREPFDQDGGLVGIHWLVVCQGTFNDPTA